MSEKAIKFNIKNNCTELELIRIEVQIGKYEKYI